MGVEACTVQAKATAKKVTSAAYATRADQEMNGKQGKARENRSEKWQEVCSAYEFKLSRSERIQARSNDGGSRDDDQWGVRASTGRSKRA